MSGDRGLFRYGFERAEGVQGPELDSVRFESENFEMAPTYEPDPNLDPSGNETEGEILKEEGTGTVTAAANSESWLRARIHHHGFYDVSTPAVGVRLYELRDFDEVDDTPVPFYIDSLNAGIWRDEEENPTEYRAFGWKVEEFELKADANKYAFFTHSGPFLRDTRMKKPDEILSDAGWTGHLIVDGARGRSDENGDYYKFKVIVAGALDGTLPLPTIRFGKGVAAYSGANTYDIPVVPNTWLYVRATDGSIAGLPREPIRIMFVADEDTDELAVNQEWRILPTSPKPIPVFSARPKLSAPACEVRFSKDGGTTFFTRLIEGGYSLKMGVPREAKFGLGSVFAQTIGRPDEARRWWELSFNGTYANLDLVNALRSGRPYQIYTRFDGELIGSTGLKDFSEFLITQSRVTKAGATIQNPGDLPENPTFRAFSSANAPLCIEKHQNAILSVTPAEDVS